jgi:hypothetical protein
MTGVSPDVMPDDAGLSLFEEIGRGLGLPNKNISLKTRPPLFNNNFQSNNSHGQTFLLAQQSTPHLPPLAPPLAHQQALP